MNRLDDKTALITGANGGIGKEVARQLALSGGYATVILACRDEGRANAAKLDLERSTGKTCFRVMKLDVSDLGSVRVALDALNQPVDVLIMNAGGMGGKTPLALTSAGVTNIIASNVLGHAALLEGMISAGLLKETAIYVSSEAARGIPKLGIKRPSVPGGSMEGFVSICNGSFFKTNKFDIMSAYAQAKYIGALWMSEVARRNPALRLLSISPGNTSGTDAPRDLPVPMRIMTKYVVMPFLGPLLGIVHGVQQGAGRLVNAIDDGALKSGGFYASRAKDVIGPLVEQSGISPELGNPVFQANAWQALHRYI